MIAKIILFSALATGAGIASRYDEFKVTANGETFNRNSFTAAHKSLPFGTCVAVSHKRKTIIVRINNRGPFVPGRVFDLTPAAADALGITYQIGLGPILFWVIPCESDKS